MFAAAIIIVAVLLCFCFISFNNIEDIFAFTDANIVEGSVDIGDILLEGYADRTDGKVFNGEILESLYEKLTGDSNKIDISDVSAVGTLSAADIRDRNGGKDIVLTMDGQKWTVAYLTKDISGNTIATLWLISSDDTCSYNSWFDLSTAYAYPANMYSTSFARAYALNSGGNGYVASKGATTLTKIEQSSTHRYAKLTMPSVKGSLTDFIVTPAAVKYQETQNNTVGGTIGDSGYTLVNEAWGTPSGTIKWYSGSGRNMD